MMTLKVGLSLSGFQMMSDLTGGPIYLIRPPYLYTIRIALVFHRWIALPSIRTYPLYIRKAFTMNYDETIRKLNELKLFGLAASFSERRLLPDHLDLSHDEFVGIIVDDEYIYRSNKKMTRLLQQAKLKFSSSSLEDIDYSQKRGLLKSKMIPFQPENCN